MDVAVFGQGSHPEKTPAGPDSPFQDSLPNGFTAIQLKKTDFDTADLDALFRKILDRENIEGKRSADNFLIVSPDSFEVELLNFKALLSDLEKKKSGECKAEYVR